MWGTLTSLAGLLRRGSGGIGLARRSSMIPVPNTPKIDQGPPRPSPESSEPDAGGIWWGLIAGALAIAILAGAFAWSRSATHTTDERNRGPAFEVAPGAQPARDIDRTRKP
jgi:hypothetical protein